mmetsp:Transcript_58925/g.131835  ORF Transcript_58925/g.131835 Transcript_58925/m.131835 type:complete len:94 (+) Transcript_58925:455-736(+)
MVVRDVEVNDDVLVEVLVDVGLLVLPKLLVEGRLDEFVDTVELIDVDDVEDVDVLEELWRSSRGCTRMASRWVDPLTMTRTVKDFSMNGACRA